MDPNKKLAKSSSESNEMCFLGSNEINWNITTDDFNKIQRNFDYANFLTNGSINNNSTVYKKNVSD